MEGEVNGLIMEGIPALDERLSTMTSYLLWFLDSGWYGGEHHSGLVHQLCRAVIFEQCSSFKDFIFVCYK